MSQRGLNAAQVTHHQPLEAPAVLVGRSGLRLSRASPRTAQRVEKCEAWRWATWGTCSEAWARHVCQTPSLSHVLVLGVLAMLQVCLCLCLLYCSRCSSLLLSVFSTTGVVLWVLSMLKPHRPIWHAEPRHHAMTRVMIRSFLMNIGNQLGNGEIIKTAIRGLIGTEGSWLRVTINDDLWDDLRLRPAVHCGMFWLGNVGNLGFILA